MNLTKREASALADALIVWRRRSTSAQMLSPAEVDDLIERLTAAPAKRRRWEYGRFNFFGATIADQLRDDADFNKFGREGWEIAAVVGNVVYLRREIIE